MWWISKNKLKNNSKQWNLLYHQKTNKSSNSETRSKNFLQTMTRKRILLLTWSNSSTTIKKTETRKDNSNKLMPCWKIRWTIWTSKLHSWFLSYSFLKKKRKRTYLRYKIFRKSYKKWWPYNSKRNELVVVGYCKIIVILYFPEKLPPKRASPVKKVTTVFEATTATIAKQKVNYKVI